MSPCPRVKRLFLDLFRFPYNITHIVERLGDRFKVSHCILKADSDSVVRGAGFDLLDTIDRFDGPPGPRGSAASDDSRYRQCVTYNGGLGSLDPSPGG